MLKYMIREWLPWILLIGILLWIWLSMTGCGLYNPDQEPEGIKWKKGVEGGKPAKNKPIFITRGDYYTKEDFQKALCKKVAWLEGKGWKVILVKPVYGKDVTQREIIRYYVIYYRR